MDIQLKELIDKIKQDGITSAEEQSSQIIKDAEARAHEIVQQAKSEASHIQQSARQEADKFTQAGTAAVQQAARDVLLQTQNQLEKLLAGVVHTKVKAEFSPAILEKAITSLMQNWQGRPVEDLSILISDDIYSEVENALLSELSDHLKKGMEIKPSSKVAAGFRIGEKDGSSYYDVTAASLADLFSRRVNTALAEIVQSAAAQK